jgi:hypothetical protein
MTYGKAGFGSSLARLRHELRQWSSKTSTALFWGVGIWLSLGGFFVSSKFDKFVPFFGVSSTIWPEIFTWLRNTNSHII